MLALCLFGCLICHAQTTASGAVACISVSQDQRFPKACRQAHKLAHEIQEQGIPGLSVAVALAGRLVYSEGFGYADLEQRVPATPATRFRIGSISKSLTAVALVRLVQQGKLDLDAPVQKYIPSFPDKGAEITPRMLAGHLSGIRHYQGNEIYIDQHYDTLQQGLKIFQDDPLLALPGTRFNYSSYGYDLLGAVMESAAEEDFLDCMEDQVFGPLSLHDTVADQNYQIVERRSRSYEMTNNNFLENAPYTDSSNKWPGGGFLSTAEDLVRFGSALLNPGFLKAESLHLLFTSQKTTDGKDSGYGMGWFVTRSKSGARIYEHSGASVGGTAQLIIYPDSQIVVALVTNLDPRLWTRYNVEEIAELFVDKAK